MTYRTFPTRTEILKTNSNPKKTTKKKLIHPFSLANIPQENNQPLPTTSPAASPTGPIGEAVRAAEPRSGPCVVIPLLPPKKKTNGWVCGSLKSGRCFFPSLEIFDRFGNFIFEQSFGEIAEVFEDHRNGVHPGLNWENNDPQHSAPTNSSEFPKPELGRAILMEASGLKFPTQKVPLRISLKEDSKRLEFVCFFWAQISLEFVCFFCDGFFHS